jgi:hexokinase
MIPTFVFGWPDGEEKGDFLAVDLGAFIAYWTSALICSFEAGGTNLRVCLVTLQSEGKFEITQSKYRLTEEQKHDDGQKLFDFCAESLKTFIDSSMLIEGGQLKNGQKLPLGFTVGISFTLS